MGRRKLTAGRDPNLPLICCVCGDKARGYNFSVLTCVSCKSFFRRHALIKLENYQCRYNENCSITIMTRGQCVCCRLKKCFEVGMDPLMIRGPLIQQKNSTKVVKVTPTSQNQNSLPLIQSLSILRNDRSNLTSEQWNLLSNIIRSYDEQNVINQVKHILKEQSSLPPKLRLKPAETMNLFSLSYLALHPLIARSSHFHSLSPNSRRAIISHNVFPAGSFNGCFVARETDTFNNPTYFTACSILYGTDYIEKCARDNKRLEINGNLIKVLLFILIFSSNCSTVKFNNEEDIETMSCSIELLHVQDIYVTMLWKYLIYIYGHDQAVIRFSLLIKGFLDMLSRTEEVLQYLSYNTLVDDIVIQTQSSLVIEDCAAV